MPRIRSVKPELWADEALARLPRDARLLFIGMLNFADDEGRMRGNPLLIRAQVFPYESEIDVSALIDALEGGGFVVRYECDGQSYLWIRNFEKHQKIEKPTASKLPPPPEKKPRRRLPDSSPTPPRAVGVGGEGKGEEEEGRGEEAPRTAPPEPPPADPPPADPPSAVSAFVAYVREHWPDVREPEKREREWADACPAVDLLAEAKKAVSWERESPANRKVDHGAFFGRWARKAQDTPGRHKPSRAGPGAAGGARPVATAADFERDEAEFKARREARQ